MFQQDGVDSTRYFWMKVSYDHTVIRINADATPDVSHGTEETAPLGFNAKLEWQDKTLPDSSASVLNPRVVSTAPPPPVYSFSHAYEIINPLKEYPCLFRILIFNACVAFLLLPTGLTCNCFSDFCPYYTGVWTALLLFITVILGIVAVRTDRTNLFVALLVLAVLSTVACIILGVFSVLNWLKVGDPEDVSHICLLRHYDADRLSYIYRFQTKYDFDSCVKNVKMGLSLNAVMILLAATESKRLSNIRMGYVCF
ncbi:unnamed protein product [Soboliphyme baturini]|uniref:Transmembrane protein n=1 Tax=Soboliphyme baturini TaxID=241478 RepID=A0A183IBF5_9BILA|nr:unnamed protein product [Soboliphyme baturini]